MRSHYDLVVIGSGPAGEKAALEARILGATVLVVERWEKPGGASVIFGTLPSKSLRETVQYINALAQVEVTGLSCGLDHELTIQELMYRKNRVTEERVLEIYAQYRALGIDYQAGVGSLQGPHQVAIHTPTAEILVEAQKIFLATGTRPFHPAGVDFNHPGILDSDSILGLKQIPKSMLIYGGGVIGSEYASIFAKLGCKVQLVEAKQRLLDFLDGEISQHLVAALQQSGVQLQLGQPYASIRGTDQGVELVLQDGSLLQAEVLLYAAGRLGNIEGLGLEKLGIEVNQRAQILVNDQFQTNLPHIYAMGDIIGPPALVSVSNREGRLAARHAFAGEDVCRSCEVMPSAIYCIPEVAMIGSTEEQLQEAGVEYVVGRCLLADLARGSILGVEEGVFKLMFQRQTKRLLGAHMIGPQASELIHIPQAVMELGGGMDYFINAVINFPTLSAGLKAAALNAQGQVALFPKGF